MAEVQFFTDQQLIPAGSGLGFFAAGGWGNSVAVGAYNKTVFITNTAGTVQGPQGDAVGYHSLGSGYINNSSSGIALTAIPNKDATVEVRFIGDSSVRVEQVFWRCCDSSSSINNNPSGITCQAAELIHPDPVATNNGSGDTTWTSIYGSGSTLQLANSPGVSGLWAANGSSQREDSYHSWYIAESLSPQSIGSKQGVNYISLEYF